MAKKLPRRKSKGAKGSGATSSSSRGPSSSNSLTLENSEFNLELAPKHQSVGVIYGESGHGKTTVATRFMPDPVALISLDGRGRSAIEEAREMDRKIYPVEINYPTDLTGIDSETAKVLGREALDKVIHHLHVAVEEAKRGRIRSIAIDTGTELTDIMNIAITGNVEKVVDDYGRSKGLINRGWWSLMRLARESEASFLVIARAKTVWKGGAPSANMEPRGVDAALEAADWCAWIRHRSKRKGFEIKMMKSGVNIEEAGETYKEDDWDEVGGPFAYISGLQYEWSDFDDWV